MTAEWGIERMKTKGIIFTVIAAMAVGVGNGRGATNEVSGLLQKGLFEEEANRNLDAAILAYQAVIAQTDKDRQFAATAIFRLGECYRKQGKTNEANAQYQRIVREFADQKELATLSRQQLGGVAGQTANANPAEQYQGKAASAEQIAEIKKLDPEKRRVAVQQMFPNPVLNALMQKMTEAEQELATLKNNLGAKHPDVTTKEALLKTIYQQIDDQVDAVLARQANGADEAQSGRMSPEQLMASTRQSMEAERIKQIQAMIRDSPDLINAFGQGRMETPLQEAVEAHELKVAAFLLDNKADTEVRDGLGRTALLTAAKNGQNEMVELLASRGADINATMVGRYEGFGALHFAADRGDKAMVEILLGHGAKVDLRAFQEVTPLMVAAKKGYKTVAETLLAKGADINARRDTGATPLHEAAYAGNKAIVELLLANHADVNATDTNGATALYMTADTGSAAIADSLLSAHADIDLATKNGWTPLMEAIAQQRWDVVELLLKRGANVKAQQKFDRGFGGWTALNFAIDKNNLEIANELIEKGADANTVAGIFAAADLVNSSTASWHDFTPLMQAVYGGKIDIVQSLLSHKANVNFRNDRGETPLLIAVKREAKDMARLLLKHGADPNTPYQASQASYNPNSSDPERHGITALGYAASKGQVDMAKLLLDHGADVNVKTAGGLTPLRMVHPSSKEMVELLLAHDANVNAADNHGMTLLDYYGNGTNEITDLLRQHGAIRGLERGTIRVRRGDQTGVVFWRDANGYNRHTLYEVLGYVYPHPLGLSYPSQLTPGHFRQPELPGFYFPDFAHMRVLHVENKAVSGLRTNMVTFE